jgi:hypothetical protein
MNESSQAPLFEIPPTGPRHDDEHLDIPNHSASPNHVPSGAADSTEQGSLEGLKKVIESDLQAIEKDKNRSANDGIGGNERTIRARTIPEKPTQAQAPGTPESQEDKAARRNDKRRLSASGKRIADKEPPDYFPYNQITGS